MRCSRFPDDTGDPMALRSLRPVLAEVASILRLFVFTNAGMHECQPAIQMGLRIDGPSVIRAVDGVGSYSRALFLLGIGDRRILRVNLRGGS